MESTNQPAGTFELFYSSGGHSGPYPTRDAARERALALLKGRPAEHHIEIRESSTAVVFIERIYQSNPCPMCGRTGAVQDAPPKGGVSGCWPAFGEDWR